jgi:hypothetical protein
MADILEDENSRLKRIVADLTLDKQIRMLLGDVAYHGQTMVVCPARR